MCEIGKFRFKKKTVIDSVCLLHLSRTHGWGINFTLKPRNKSSRHMNLFSEKVSVVAYSQGQPRSESYMHQGPLYQIYVFHLSAPIIWQKLDPRRASCVEVPMYIIIETYITETWTDKRIFTCPLQVLEFSIASLEIANILCFFNYTSVEEISITFYVWFFKQKIYKLLFLI